MRAVLLACIVGLPCFAFATPEGNPPAGNPLADSPLAADLAAEDVPDADAEDAPPAEPVLPVPRVELIFVGVNQEVYSLYGHSAMLVVDDPDAPIEHAELFNFGVTDFTVEGYVQRFLTGRVEFWGDSRRYGRQLRRWIKADRTVIRRVINLEPEATRRLIEHLRLDITAARRHYIYDTFRENCSTRLRDYLDLYSDGAVFGTLGTLRTERSFRDDVREAYAALPPLLALTEVVPGIELDRPRTMWELTYLPAMLMTGLAMVTTDRGALLGYTTIDHQRTGPDPREGLLQSGQLVVGAFGAIFLLLAAFGRRLPRRLRGVVLAGYALVATGLGVLLVVVGLGSDWPDMQRNWLLAACPPTDLILLVPAFGLMRDRVTAPEWVRQYLAVRGALAVLLLVFTPWAAVTGPIVPRLVALAGLILAWRMCDSPSALERTPRPRRLLGNATGRYPAISDARRRAGERHLHTRSHL